MKNPALSFKRVLMLMLLAALAACGPTETPTPTRDPRDDLPIISPTPTTTEEAVEETEVAETEEAAETEAAETEEAGDDATEAAGDDATEEADEDATESASTGDFAGLEATVNVTRTNLRREPNGSAELIMQLDRIPVLVLGRNENSSYYYLRTEDGTEGWAPSQNIALTERFADVPVYNP